MKYFKYCKIIRENFWYEKQRKNKYQILQKGQNIFLN